MAVVACGCECVFLVFRFVRRIPHYGVPCLWPEFALCPSVYGFCLEMVSSRLRGFDTVRRDCCLLSVPPGIIGRCCLWIRMLGTCVSVTPICVCGHTLVQAHFRCVVSKRLRILFRDGLLPVCGVSALPYGSADGCRFRRCLLVCDSGWFGRLSIGVS